MLPGTNDKGLEAFLAGILLFKVGGCAFSLLSLKQQSSIDRPSFVEQQVAATIYLVQRRPHKARCNHLLLDHLKRVLTLSTDGIPNRLTNLDVTTSLRLFG